MKKQVTVLTFCVFVPLVCADDLTNQLHQEIRSQTHPTINISEESHPVLYQLVADLADQARVKMPRYITIFRAEKNIITSDGVFHTIVQDINPSVGVFGDMYLCYEVLLELSYEDIKSMVAIAISEKAHHSPLKPILFAGLGTLSSIPIYNNFTHAEFSLRRTPLLLVATVFAVYNIITNYTQRVIDKDASYLLSTGAILCMLKKMRSVQEKYTQEGFLIRMASKLGLRELWSTVTFPFRSSTFQERIDDLQNEASFEACAT